MAHAVDDIGHSDPHIGTGSDDGFSGIGSPDMTGHRHSEADSCDGSLRQSHVFP